jgi:hypothetical protein
MRPHPGCHFEKLSLEFLSIRGRIVAAFMICFALMAGCGDAYEEDPPSNAFSASSFAATTSDGGLRGEAQAPATKDIAPPEITVLEPRPSATVPTTFTVKLSVTDDVSGVASIELFLDGKLNKTSTDSQATITLSDIAEKIHFIKVIATDNVGFSDSVEFPILVQNSDSSGHPISTGDSSAGHSSSQRGGTVFIEGGCNVTAAPLEGASGQVSIILLAVLMMSLLRGGRKSSSPRY